MQQSKRKKRRQTKNTKEYDRERMEETKFFLIMRSSRIKGIGYKGQGKLSHRSAWARGNPIYGTKESSNEAAEMELN